MDDETIFGDSPAQDISIILLMRMYDIMMSQFMLEYPEEGEKLYNLHAEGGFLNPTIGYDQSKIIG